MPEPPRGTGARPALRPSRPQRDLEQPAYAADILDEADEHSRPYVAGDAPELPPEDKTDPGQSAPPYDGPKWLAHVPAHSPTVLGVIVVGCAVVLSALLSSGGVGLIGALLAVVSGTVLLARELRAAEQSPGFTERMPAVLMTPEAAATATAVMVALALRSLSLGVLPLLMVAGVGLLAHDQYRKVIAGADGVGAYFEPRQLLAMPQLVGLGGVAVCLLALFAPWGTVKLDVGVPDNAPVPQGPPELRVIATQRPTDDMLYSYGGGVTHLRGWDLPASVVVELALLAVLALLALRPEVERPSWTRYLPAGAVALALAFGGLHMRLLPGPFVFVFGLGAVGFVAVQHLRAARAAALAPRYDDSEDETEEAG
ncbi:zinc ribbon domain-containing protein [Myxococcus vastator]|uniref:zinc ribbon domain-containing protein n=1 Tax=Myxococcus vastator TaxID=2709664 RepID=UPI001F082322|nr:zinc ribbon domain-containing protein [Myxococcus vastator]